MAVQTNIFNSIKSILLSARNPSNVQIFKLVNLYREEQVNDQPKDQIKAYPYASVDFTNVERENLGSYMQEVQYFFSVRLHILEMDYDKLDMFDLVDTTLRLLNWGEVSVDDTLKINITSTNEEGFLKQEMETIYQIDFETQAITQKQCPYIQILENSVDYLLRVENEGGEAFVPSGTSGVYRDGTNWLPLNDI